MKRIVVVMLTAAFLMGACSAKEGIEVSDAWARSSTQGMNSAVYFVIENHNAEVDELIGATSDVAEAVEVHESRMEGDVMTMNRVDRVILEPSVTVEFMPGESHVMLIGLKQDLNAGDEIQVNLQFRNSLDIPVRVAVREASGTQSMEGHSP